MKWHSDRRSCQICTEFESEPNFDTDLPVQDVYDFNERVFKEDKAIVKAPMPECLPLDPLLEAHIPADMSSMAYRRALRDMRLSRFFIA